MALGYKKNIIWLVSYPKSGNTWYRIFINNLNAKSDDPININNLNGVQIASSRKVFDQYSGIVASELSNEEIDNILPLVYKKISTEGRDNIYIKAHDVWHVNTENKAVFPADITKGVIYIIRNPLDVAVSISEYRQKNYSETISDMNNVNFSISSKQFRLNKQLKQKLSSWSEHVTSWVEDSDLPVHVIRFEDMLNNTFNAFHKSIQFLELEYTKGEILKAINNSSFQLLQKQEKESGFNEKMIRSNTFFRHGKSNNWIQHLKKKHIQELISHHKIVMKKYGYLAENEQIIYF